MNKITVNGNNKAYVIVTAIICLAVMEIVALCNGINGTLFTMVVAVIAGAIGVVIPTPKILKV